MSSLVDINLCEKIKRSKILLVGAGGIGCEILKNLILSGFEDIDVIDLDIIDVSNLNRQFLFQRCHVGCSKSHIAAQSVRKLNPRANIRSHQANIMTPEYGVHYFKQFSAVLGALDNRAARSHVNRLCLAAGVVLLESGTAGYLGQSTVIKRGVTECYECHPKSAQKTFPGCTIRNTPSELIHCTVWSKHLFNQLFGEADPDEDVSPDTADPEISDIDVSSFGADGNVKRVSTRMWAIQSQYSARKLFQKLFHDDIIYLLKMDKLWLKRRAPKPLIWDDLVPFSLQDDSQSHTSFVDDCNGFHGDNGFYDNLNSVWSLEQCVSVFRRCVMRLHRRVDAEKSVNEVADGDKAMMAVDFLVWDKDDEDCMDFVVACANIRAHIFGIQTLSKFEIKSQAGNIIPAIATTNAIAAGIVVLQLFNVLLNQFQNCSTVYLRKNPNTRGQLFVKCSLPSANLKCYVCADKPEVTLCVNIHTFTLRELKSRVLTEHMHMTSPHVIHDTRVLLDADEEDCEDTMAVDYCMKSLAELGLVHGSRLRCDDMCQNYELIVNLNHCSEDMDTRRNAQNFEIIGDVAAARLESAQTEVNVDESTSNGIVTSNQHNECASDDDILEVSVSEDDISSVQTVTSDDIHICDTRIASHGVPPQSPSLRRKRHSSCVSPGAGEQTEGSQCSDTVMGKRLRTEKAVCDP